MTGAPSLRRTALAWITALLALVGLIAAGAAYSYSESETAVLLDGPLRQIALNAGPGLSAAHAPATPDQDPEDRFVVTVWDAAGHAVHRLRPGVEIPLQPQSGFADVDAGGEAWRVYTLHGKHQAVQVAQRVTVRDEIASNAALGAALPVLILIPLSWLVVGVALHRMLRRLDGLASDLATRGALATDPLRLTGVPSELVPLVESMNGLILRLNAALTAQKRFLTDAAHTLRTPIAAMQIEIGNLAADVPATGQRSRLEALAAAVRRAATLVDQLLRLARLDESRPPSRVLFDAAALLLDCVADQTPLASRKGIDLGAAISSPAMVSGVEEEVQTLFANLIENALTYTPAGGKVDVALRRAIDGFSAEVLDTGPGLPAGTEARIFQRFYRAAPQATEGSGLGLAIARRIAERHGFGLEVRNRADGASGVLARVIMPACPA
ncbi:MAG TPA: ATP-binding protein [Rhodocyclaceae bacterium]|nr:ATP-binding protein [Rhodocyclaceae bacterium]